MRLITKNQSGFSPVIVVVAIVAVALAGLLGYVAYNRFVVGDDNVAEQSKVANDIDAVTTSVPEEIVSTSDLDQVTTSLDQVTDSKTTEDIDLINSQLEEF